MAPTKDDSRAFSPYYTKYIRLCERGSNPVSKEGKKHGGRNLCVRGNKYNCTLSISVPSDMYARSMLMNVNDPFSLKAQVYSSSSPLFDILPCVTYDLALQQEQL